MSDPLASTSDTELRSHLERLLAGQYDLDAELGRGGMGIVYRARDRRLKRTVAIKVLPPELGFRAEIRARFLREAETAAQLSHPNIVPIYSVDEKENLVFFVMAFIDGENLAHRIHMRGAMDQRDARRVLRDVADALAYAHSHKVIHRDIKPDNILLDGQSGRPMVTDFGIARAISEGADSRLTATGIAIGTPAYMSPEQSAGDKEVDGRSDLYSLGVVAYQMLSGELPFIASSTPAMLVKHLSEQPMPLQLKRPGVPPDLAAAVMCLLAKDPADRFASASALLEVLDGGGAIPVAKNLPRPAHTWSPLPPQPEGAPTVEELARWNAPVVEEFRRKLPPYIVVNFALFVMSVFTGFDAFVSIVGLWTVYIAFKYAKVWSAGYDWRDVFRQPQDRLIFDVVAEWVDDLQAWFDRDKRDEVRARWRARRLRPSFLTPSPSGLPAAIGGPAGASPADMALIGSSRGNLAKRALQDRDEILQLVASLPSRDRKQLKDVDKTVKALADRVRDMAIALAELDRTAPAGGAEGIDAEIARLEAQANPLDRAASESRVRRLATLKRDRRGAAERTRRREELEAKLESCALALQNLRFDVLRLKTGASTTQNVTLIAERAMSVAQDVDGLIAANSAARDKTR